jgi:uncharacterized protein (DUF427 family)
VAEPVLVRNPPLRGSSAGELRWEPSARWVRGTVGGTTVVDSRHPVLVWQEWPPVPFYAFPRAELRADLLSPATAPPVVRQTGAARWFDLTVAGTRLPLVAWEYDLGELAGHLGFDFGRIEHWYEEDEEIFVHPRDPHSRVDAIASSRHVQVRIGGQLVADSHRPVVLFETGLPPRYYLPPEDVDLSRFTRTDLHTRCPYKGEASYWTYTGGAGVPDNVLWFYPAPIATIPQIKDLLCFYDEHVDVIVDGELQERPEDRFRRRHPAAPQ